MSCFPKCGRRGCLRFSLLSPLRGIPMSASGRFAFGKADGLRGGLRRGYLKNKKRFWRSVTIGA